MPFPRLPRKSAALRQLGVGAGLVGLLLVSGPVGAARNRVQTSAATVSTVSPPTTTLGSPASGETYPKSAPPSAPASSEGSDANLSFQSERLAATAAAVRDGISVTGRPRRLADMAIGVAGAARIQRESSIDSRRYAQLAKDRTVHIDQTGRILFVDSVPVAPSAGSVLSAQANPDAGLLNSIPIQAPPISASPSEQTFQLHSRPGSNRTLYLDFNGATLSGTVWDQAYNSQQPLVLAPYDSDGVPGSFSTTELTLIQRVWRAVAEDFAPFNVDVTTEEPSAAALQRTSNADFEFGTSVVITPTNVTCFCSGVAYLHSFSGSDGFKPALVYTDGWWNTSPEDIANIVAHESGHTLGLSHDGATGTEYFGGHGNWQSIMGSASFWQRPYSHWSKGEYSGANNSEDDLAIISANAPFVADDHGWAIATATELSVPSASVGGLIENDADVDVFGLSGRIGIDAVVDSNDVGPNLIPTLYLLSGSGTVVSSVVGAGVHLRANFATPARYYLAVSAEPVGNALTGISGYGNIGRYRLSVESAPLPVAPSTLTSVGGIGSITLQWTDNSNNLSFTSYEVSYCLGSTCQTATVAANGSSPRSFVLTGLNAGEVYTYRVRAENERGFSSWISSSVSPVVQGFGPVEITSVSADATAHTFGWTVPAKVPVTLSNPAIYSVRWRNVTASGPWTESTTIGSSFTIPNPVAGEVYQFQVRAGDGLGYFGSWGAYREAIVGREAASTATSATSSVPTIRSTASNGTTGSPAGRSAAPSADGVRASG